ncbi:MAG: metal ABC transporter substrate-binding protein [Verrucomicrobia bacterium]|nr:metal ABC transporter substrate-binding protein [Verrucomicrobiota bacterium]
MTQPILSGLFTLVAAAHASAAPMQVSALHPLMADLARQVGGERVTVFDLVGEGGSPHRFEPRPADLAKMQSSALVLAAGKNLEPYLSRLKETLKEVTVVEVGRTLPSLMVGTDEDHGANPPHADGTVDPHWWHGVENMRRAARVVALAMAEQDPAGKVNYLLNAGAYGERLGQLQRWARSELAKVPQAQRKLVTAHHAFGYFAQEFGFEVIAVAGLNNEQNNTPQELAKTIAAVRLSGVKAIFPERTASAKVLQSIATATGASLGEPLIADGNGTGKEAGFEAMIRHNVDAITKALAAP